MVMGFFFARFFILLLFGPDCDFLSHLPSRYSSGIRQAHKRPLARFKDTRTNFTEWLTPKRLTS